VTYMIVKRPTDDQVVMNTELSTVLCTNVSNRPGVVTRQQAVWHNEEL